MTGSVRLHPNDFTFLLTLSSKFFSTFPHGTCPLSVSWPYLALDGVYHPLRAALSSNPTRRRGPIPERCDGRLLAWHRLWVHGPVQGRLGPSRAPRQRGRPVRYNSHTCRDAKARGEIQRWARFLFARRYWGNHGCFLFLRLLICL